MKMSIKAEGAVVQFLSGISSASFSSPSVCPLVALPAPLKAVQRAICHLQSVICHPDELKASPITAAGRSFPECNTR